jgi:hypothetical protein
MSKYREQEIERFAEETATAVCSECGGVMREMIPHVCPKMSAGKTTYRILDESELPEPPRSGGQWGELRNLMNTLPEGKWVEIPVPEGRLATSIAQSIIQNFRVARSGYKISYRRDASGRRLFISKKPLDGDAQ